MKLSRTGYYWIKDRGYKYPARWDGKKWMHENGTSAYLPNHSNVLAHGLINKLRNFFGLSIKPLSGVGCPLGCVCTTNPDGSIHTDCGQ